LRIWPQEYMQQHLTQAPHTPSLRTVQDAHGPDSAQWRPRGSSPRAGLNGPA
jgi:hypothetical protein